MNNPPIKPFFTVVLPTYNRADLLPFSIKSVLKQDLDNFELIVLDNHSTDNTPEVVASFHNKKIRYIRNKKNLGYFGNIKKGFSLAKGEYTFLLSDDDLIARKDSLSKMYALMKKHKLGYAQTNLFYFDHDPSKPSLHHHVADENVILEPTPDVFTKTVSWHFGFISGNIFQTNLVDIRDLVDDIWWVYFPSIYKIISKKRFMYIHDHLILAKISQQGLVSHIDLTKNHDFNLDHLFKILKRVEHNAKFFKEFQNFHLNNVIKNLPGTKLYTNNHNVMVTIEKVLSYKGVYTPSLAFLLYAVFTLITPKPFLSVLRKIRIVFGQRNIEKIIQSNHFNQFLSDIEYEQT